MLACTLEPNRTGCHDHFARFDARLDRSGGPDPHERSHSELGQFFHRDRYGRAPDACGADHNRFVVEPTERRGELAV